MLLDLTMPEWVEDAACAHPLYDPEWWFPHGQTITRENEQAIRICQACPVKTECLQWRCRDETRNSKHGIWGGLTPQQRRPRKARNKL